MRTTAAELALLAVLLLGVPVFADGQPNEQVITANRTATAVAHAAAELANALAQGKTTLTPTPTPVPTDTPTSTSTPAPTPTPTPDDPSPTPTPALPAPAPGSNPVRGYLQAQTATRRLSSWRCGRAAGISSL